MAYSGTGSRKRARQILCLQIPDTNDEAVVVFPESAGPAKITRPVSSRRRPDTASGAPMAAKSGHSPRLGRNVATLPNASLEYRTRQRRPPHGPPRKGPDAALRTPVNFARAPNLRDGASGMAHTGERMRTAGTRP